MREHCRALFHFLSTIFTGLVLTHAMAMAQYTTLHHKHFGVIAVPLLRCLVDFTTAPCRLHRILAIHRLFWKAIFNISTGRDQIDLIS